MKSLLSHFSFLFLLPRYRRTTCLRLPLSGLARILCAIAWVFFPNEAIRSEMEAGRESDRRAVLAALAAEDLVPADTDPEGDGTMTPSLARAIHAFLARSRAGLMRVQGKVAAARDCYQQALEMRRALFGIDDRGNGYRFVAPGANNAKRLRPLT